MKRYEALWYYEDDSYDTAEFSTEQALLNFYKRHKNDADKSGWWLTKRNKDWEVIEDIYLEDDNGLLKDDLDEEYAINDLMDYLEGHNLLSYPYTEIENEKLIIYGKWVSTRRRVMSNYTDINIVLKKYAQKHNLIIDSYVITSIDSRDDYTQERVVLKVNVKLK